MLWSRIVLIMSTLWGTIQLSCLDAHRPLNVINQPGPYNRSLLRKKPVPVQFPLSQEDQKVIQDLVQAYEALENCAGLSAIQIGHHKPIIIFAVEDKEGTLKKWRPDLTDTMPRTIWINPTYEGIGSDKHEDVEGCFSVKNLVGPVKRFRTIRYRAQLPDGTYVQGIANGFLARVIQHEVDHTQGILCIDRIASGKVTTAQHYREMRKKAMETK